MVGLFSIPLGFASNNLSDDKHLPPSIEGTRSLPIYHTLYNIILGENFYQYQFVAVEFFTKYLSFDSQGVGHPGTVDGNAFLGTGEGLHLARLGFHLGQPTASPLSVLQQRHVVRYHFHAR